tara:strand:+ start:3065 stop:3577 length:513 start_codon:yes stop_codon:yes gene_type:complete
MFIPGKFNDTLIRNEVIKFFKQRFRINLKHNDIHNKIDLVGINDPTLGVEVEHGKWVGNFWDNQNYSLISEQSFQTANIPARKEKYWLDQYYSYNKLRENESSKKNIFVRSNGDFTQFIVIRPNTIRDSDKLVRSKFKPRNSNEVEEWLSFRKEHVETYNMKNGKYYKVK